MSDCKNFRDVGEFINIIAGKKIMVEKKVYRGGKIDFIDSLADINSPKTIVNLRMGKDPVFENSEQYHFPITSEYDKYQTQTNEVRKWLNTIIKCFCQRDFRYPVFIHCAFGKDRTGIVTAVLLSIMGIPREIIIEEYLLSDGEIKREWIENTLDGIQNIDQYFSRIKSFDPIKENLLIGK